MTGGATIATNIAYLVGGVSGSGLTAANGVYTGVDPLIDPYLNAAVPSYSGCDSNNYKATGGGGSSLTAAGGTTLILTTSVATKACANTKFDGGANIAITAPTSGALSGLPNFFLPPCPHTKP